MTITELRDEIVLDIGGDSSDTALLAKIFSFIKSAMRRFPRHTRTRLLLTTSYATLSSGRNYLTIPTGFISERFVYRLSGESRKEIEKSSNFNEIMSTSAGVPAYYRIVGNIVEFDKTADTDYVIYIEHFEEVDDVALTDGFFGSSDMVEMVKDGAKYYYYEYEEDSERSANQLTLFNIGLNKLENDFRIEESPTHIEEA